MNTQNIVSRPHALSRPWIALAVLFFSGFLARPAVAESLTGTVTNSATGRTLQGARVAIKAANVEAATDTQGVYRFENLPPGNVVVSVSYTGLSTSDVSVAIASGVPNRRDVGLTADIYRMD